MVKNPPANAGDAGDVDSVPGLGRSPGGEKGNPLQYSCLGKSVGRGAWQVTVCGLTKSRTWLSMHTHLYFPISRASSMEAKRKTFFLPPENSSPCCSSSPSSLVHLPSSLHLLMLDWYVVSVIQPNFGLLAWRTAKPSMDTRLRWRKVQYLLPGTKQGERSASVQKTQTWQWPLREGF